MIDTEPFKYIQIYLKGSLSIIIFHTKVYLIARNFPLNENSQRCFLWNTQR